MNIFASLTNRIFFGSALLAVLAIGAAIYNVNAAVTAQAELELLRGLEEAGTLIEENQRGQVEHFSREARLIADLPRLKASVTEEHPTTALGVAREYQQQLAADLLLVTDRDGNVLASLASPAAAGGSYEGLPGVKDAQSGREAIWFWPHPGGVLQVVSVPIWIDPRQPEILGTLSIGFTLDNEVANRFRRLTNSDIAFVVNGAIQASTLPPASWPTLTPLLGRAASPTTVVLNSGEYVAVTRDLSRDRRALAVILRSRTERLRFLSALHTRLFVTAAIAVLAATLLSYAIARTITRPLGVITATMRDMATTGDLTRKIPVRQGSRWDDEDARLLATTFNTMTDSIGRFQREAAQRERLSSLGRLSTVVAHEIRNPLMIIMAALRTLWRDPLPPEALSSAVTDIDEETARLNRIVTEVLDFAKPIKFDLSPTDVNAVCEAAARVISGFRRARNPPQTATVVAARECRQRTAAPDARQHLDERPDGRRRERGGLVDARRDYACDERAQNGTHRDRGSRPRRGYCQRGPRSRIRSILHDPQDGNGAGPRHFSEYHRGDGRHYRDSQPAGNRD